jgi:DNA-directed RNA polymerase specialized sigma24 family protein
MNAAAAHYYARIYGSARAGCLAELRRAGCSGEEAEDIFGTTLERIMGKFDPTDSPYAEAQLVSLLKKACLQKLIDERRHRRVLRMVPLEGMAGRLEDGTEGPAEAVERREALAMGREAIASLPERDRRLFLQRNELHLSPDEILSRNPGLSRRTYRKVIQRANARALEAFEEIVAGERCEQMSSRYLRRYVAGEATKKELAVIRVHLRGCRSCRINATRMRSHLHELAAGLTITLAAGHAGRGAQLAELLACGLDALLDRGQGLAESTRHAWGRLRELGLRVAVGAPGAGGDAVAGQAAGISAAKIVPACAGALAVGCLAASVVPGVEIMKSVPTHPAAERHHSRPLPAPRKDPALRQAPTPTTSVPSQAREETTTGHRSTRQSRAPSTLRTRKVREPSHAETATATEQVGVEFGGDAEGAGQPYSPIPSTSAAPSEDSGGADDGLARSRSAGSEPQSKPSHGSSEFGF